MSGCTKDERCWRVIRPPPFYDNSETSPQEIHQCQQHTDKVQCWTAQKQGHTSFPDQPFQQVPAATRADRRRRDGHWNTVGTLQGALARHMWRGPWQEEDSTRNGSLPTPPTSWKQGEKGKQCWTTAEQEQLRQRHRKSTQQWTEVKRSIKKDKRDYIDDLARQAETAAGQGNMRDLYLVTKKLTGRFQQTDKPVMDKNGNPLTTTKEQLKRWAEHFRELLNCPSPDSPPDIPSAETELPISCYKPSKAEIKKAIMTLRSGKAAGPDEITVEAIKADIMTAVKMLYSLFSKIWEKEEVEKEEVPAQWKEGIIIKLPKKGDLRDCSNCRGIMLLPMPGKVLNRVLLERMKEAVDPKLRDQQAGFRRNRSCADQFVSLCIIVEQSLEWNSPLYINFIDYEKAFDSVDRKTMWKLLGHYGVPEKIISLIRCTFQDIAAELPMPASCLKVLRWRLEFGRDACFHFSSSSWSSTGSWRPLQKVGTTVCSGHSGCR